MWQSMSILVTLIKYFWLFYLFYSLLCLRQVSYTVLSWIQTMYSCFRLNTIMYPTDLIFITIPLNLFYNSVMHTSLGESYKCGHLQQLPYSFISSYFEKDYKLVLFIRVVMFSSNDKVFKKSRRLQKTSV